MNGEKYIFGKKVIAKGKQMVKRFEELRRKLPAFKANIDISDNNKNLRIAKEEMNIYLEEFDKLWVNYEKNYVLELMVIESDSRRPIVKAI